jgi:hypothetical protein
MVISVTFSAAAPAMLSGVGSSRGCFRLRLASRYPSYGSPSRFFDPSEDEIHRASLILRSDLARGYGRRRRARAGDPHALHHLAGWLTQQGGLDELRELLTDHPELLASSWEPTYGQHQMKVLHLSPAMIVHDPADRFAECLVVIQRRRVHHDCGPAHRPIRSHPI